MAAIEENPEKYFDKYLQDIVMNFMIAGRDTSAITLSWFFHSLSQIPGVEKDGLRIWVYRYRSLWKFLFLMNRLKGETILFSYTSPHRIAGIWMPSSRLNVLRCKSIYIHDILNGQR